MNQNIDLEDQMCTCHGTEHSFVIDKETLEGVIERQTTVTKAEVGQGLADAFRTKLIYTELGEIGDQP